MYLGSMTIADVSKSSMNWVSNTRPFVPANIRYSSKMAVRDHCITRRRQPMTQPVRCYTLLSTDHSHVSLHHLARSFLPRRLVVFSSSTHQFIYIHCVGLATYFPFITVDNDRMVPFIQENFDSISYSVFRNINERFFIPFYANL